MDLSDKKLILVSGKGGVGKSSVAAALALKISRQGKRVLLAELGSQSFYESFFETRGIGYEPIEIAPDFHLALFTPEECLQEYVTHYVKLPKLYDLLFDNRVTRAFLNAAPALSEISLLGKITSDIRDVVPTGYDVMVVDCYSSGYAMALLRAPKAIAGAFRIGPIHDESESIFRAISNPKTTHYVLVTLAEEMPVQETLELKTQLKDEFNAETTVVCTRLFTPPLGLQDIEAVIPKIHEKNFHQFSEFLYARLKVQDQQLSRLSEIAPGFYGVPHFVNLYSGQQCLDEICKKLEAPWNLKS